MSKRINSKLTLLTLMLLITGPSLAQDEAALRKDLTSVIALLGLPCGQVVKVTPLGKDDNLATCKDGNRYRVYINKQGRVVAEKR